MRFRRGTTSSVLWWRPCENNALDAGLTLRFVSFFDGVLTGVGSMRSIDFGRRLRSDGAGSMSRFNSRLGDEGLFDEMGDDGGER